MHKSPPIDTAKHTSGLFCSVYRDAKGTDCTNSGITSKVDRVILLGPGVEGPFDITAELPFETGYAPALYLHAWLESGEIVRRFASPHPDPHEGGYMFGGNFIYTSDSRFPGGCPIHVHDRQEGRR